jgi:hypothetical protein
VVTHLTSHRECRRDLVVNRSRIAGSHFAFAPAVQCRIEVRDENGRRVVRLAGRLGRAQVADLFEACSQTTLPPQLVLDDLVSADAMGIDALMRIEQNGGELIGLPEYLRLKLNDLARESS